MYQVNSLFKPGLSPEILMSCPVCEDNDIHLEYMGAPDDSRGNIVFKFMCSSTPKRHYFELAFNCNKSVLVALSNVTETVHLQ